MGWKEVKWGREGGVVEVVVVNEEGEEEGRNLSIGSIVHISVRTINKQ